MKIKISCPRCMSHFFLSSGYTRDPVKHCPDCGLDIPEKCSVALVACLDAYRDAEGASGVQYEELGTILTGFSLEAMSEAAYIAQKQHL